MGTDSQIWIPNRLIVCPDDKIWIPDRLIMDPDKQNKVPDSLIMGLGYPNVGPRLSNYGPG